MTNNPNGDSDVLGDQLTVKEAATLSRIGRSKLYELMDPRDGEPPAILGYRLGGNRFVSKRSLAAYLRAGLQGQPTAGRGPDAETVPAGEAGGVPAPAESAAPVAAVAATAGEAAVLAPALSAAQACAYCSWEFAEAAVLAPDNPVQGDRARLDLLRSGAAATLADLLDAVRDGYRLLPEALPLLERVAVGPPVTVALPDDHGAGLSARSLAEPTAHAVAHRLGLHVLMRAWRVADPTGYRAALEANDAPDAALDAFDPQAVADLVQEK